MTIKSGKSVINVRTGIASQLLIGILVALCVTGCSSTSHIAKKNVIDTSGDKPKWVSEPKMNWESDETIFFKAKEVIRGDQRENACFELAELDNRAALLQGIKTFMKGAVDNAQMGISEDSELMLGLTRSTSYEGQVYGFKNLERYVERTEVCKGRDCTERVECYSLSGISRKDFGRTVRSVADKIDPLDPRIREAINKKAAKFFEAPANPVGEAQASAETVAAPAPAPQDTAAGDKKESK